MSAAAAESAASRCPRCGAGLAPDQDWCTGCGLAVTTRILSPPSVRWPLAIAVLLIILAGGGIGLAVASLTRDGGHAAPRALPPRAPLVPPPTGPTGASSPTGPVLSTGPSGPIGPKARARKPKRPKRARTGTTGPAGARRTSTTGATGKPRRSTTGPAGAR